MSNQILSNDPKINDNFVFPGYLTGAYETKFPAIAAATAGKMSGANGPNTKAISNHTVTCTICGNVLKGSEVFTKLKQPGWLASWLLNG